MTTSADRGRPCARAGRLRHILTNAVGFEVVGRSERRRQHDRTGASTEPLEVLVLDLSMPGRNGVELIKQIKEEKPALRILVLTMHAEQQYAARAFKAGASGYLTKESASAELVAAVTKVAAGGVYVSLAMAERFAQSLNEPADRCPISDCPTANSRCCGAFAPARPSPKSARRCV